MFRLVPLSIIRSFFTVNTANLYDIPLLCVQWKTPDDGQRNCPKHVEFHSKNKFEKLVHLVGFIVREYFTLSADDTVFCNILRIFHVYYL